MQDLTPFTLLAMAAGLTAVSILKEESPYLQLDRLAGQLVDGIRECSVKHGIPIHQNRVGSMMCRFFTDKPVTDLESAMTSDTKLFAKYFKAILAEGIYLAPSQFEAGFVSTAHTVEDIEKTIEAHNNALKKFG